MDASLKVQYDKMEKVRKPIWVYFPLLTFPPQSLLIDGYISHSFQSRPAQQYILCLLKSDSIPHIKPSSYPDREGYFFLVGPTALHAQAQPFDTSNRLLDRALVTRGTVVPQTMWSPNTVTDKRQHVEEAVLQLPIFFEGIDGRLGLSLEDSAAGRCHGLRNAQQFAPLGQKSTTHIRIGVSVFSHSMIRVIR
jgi:hypothetical protein